MPWSRPVRGRSRDASSCVRARSTAADANEIMLGVLGRALEYCHMDLFGLCFASNHYHLLIGAESALHMARFEGHLNVNLARKIGKLHGWQDKLWARRYRPMIISDEPDAQLARLKYVLAGGTKEGLVASPYDWPAPNMARSIVHGEPLVGHWFDGTKEWAARRRGEDFGKYDYATRYEIEIQPLPAFRHLSRDAYRDLIANLVTEIEEEAAAIRGGRPVLGAEAILAQDPHEPPRKVKKSPAPMLFFAKTKELLDEMKGDYNDFVTEYRDAAERLLAAQEIGGSFDPQTELPHGCFPPALSFVGRPLRQPPPRPPSRLLEYDENRRTIIGRGEIPIVRVPRASRPGSASSLVAVLSIDSSDARTVGRCHDPPSMRPT